MHPDSPGRLQGLVQGGQIAMQPAGMEKSYLSAMQQCTSTFPSPVLGSSSLSIYPPIVSANNRALHIYSIFHLSFLERATKHQ